MRAPVAEISGRVDLKVPARSRSDELKRHLAAQSQSKQPQKRAFNHCAWTKVGVWSGYSRANAVPRGEPGGCFHVCPGRSAVLGVPQPRRWAAMPPCLSGSRFQDSLLQILRNKGGRLPRLPPAHTLPARRRKGNILPFYRLSSPPAPAVLAAVVVPERVRAASRHLLSAAPARAGSLSPAFGWGKRSADTDPRHGLLCRLRARRPGCSSPGTEPAPGPALCKESGCQRRRLRFETVFSIRARRADWALYWRRPPPEARRLIYEVD